MHKIRSDTTLAMKHLYEMLGTYVAVARKLNLDDSDRPLVRHLVLGNHGKVSAAKERMIRKKLGMKDIRENRIRISVPREYSIKLDNLNNRLGTNYSFKDIVDIGFVYLLDKENRHE